jgi:sarcosine oxidase subunit delta
MRKARAHNQTCIEVSMRIPCPFCGLRDHHEFTYLGDATLKRPEASSGNIESDFANYVYVRSNPEGWHTEFWYHASGCRSWIRVRRHTRTHEISGAQLARVPA